MKAAEENAFKISMRWTEPAIAVNFYAKAKFAPANYLVSVRLRNKLPERGYVLFHWFSAALNFTAALLIEYLWLVMKAHQYATRTSSDKLDTHVKKKLDFERVCETFCTIY